jgi:3-dehydroquinate synthase
VKYGIIADEPFFGFLEKNVSQILSLEPGVMRRIIRRCCEIKADIVSRDEREMVAEGGRALLNCGHTIGHAIETALRYRGIRHGEAVLLGLVGECDLARTLGMISDAECRRIIRLIGNFPVPRVMKKIPEEAFYPLMMRDKKTTSGVLRFALPAGLGSSTVVSGIDRKSVRHALRAVKEFEEGK